MISINRILAHLHMKFKQVSIPPTRPEVVHELEIPCGGSKTTHKTNKTGASRYHCTLHTAVLPQCLFNPPRKPEPPKQGGTSLGVPLEFSVHTITMQPNNVTQREKREKETLKELLFENLCPK